jgi:hypothetical protein
MSGGGRGAVVIRLRFAKKVPRDIKRNCMIVQSTMGGLLLFKQKVECGGNLYYEKMG